MIEIKQFNHVLDDGRCSFALRFSLEPFMVSKQRGFQTQEFLYHSTTLPQDIAKMAYCFCFEFIRSRLRDVVVYICRNQWFSQNFCCESWPFQAGKINANQDHWMSTAGYGPFLVQTCGPCIFGPQNMLFSKGIQLSSDQNHGIICRIYGFDATQLYGDYIKPGSKDPVISPSGFCGM